MVNLCTLFDSNYLDRGIVLYQSLLERAKEFTLYIFCFDNLAFETLDQLKLDHAILIAESEILDEELLQIKNERKRAEYCWTCTPVIIQYVLDRFAVNDCTYIDADMMFYGDPQILLDEFYKAKASIGIMEHRFPQNIARNKRERCYGKYCVEFNTFRNNDLGRQVLDNWKESCFRLCTMEFMEESFGDQKYVEKWETEFEGVYVYKNPGAGVAPWNISDYRPISLAEDIQMFYRHKEPCNLIFYHFQSLMVLEDNKAFIGVYNELGRKNKEFISYLYRDYLSKIMNVRRQLAKIGMEIPLQKLRKGEKSSISKMSFKDFLIFCYQCIPCVLSGKKNYMDLKTLNGEQD